MIRHANEGQYRRLESKAEEESFVAVLGVCFVIALYIFAILEISLAAFQESETPAAASDIGETGP